MDSPISWTCEEVLEFSSSSSSPSESSLSTPHFDALAFEPLGPTPDLTLEQLYPSVPDNDNILLLVSTPPAAVVPSMAPAVVSSHELLRQVVTTMTRECIDRTPPPLVLGEPALASLSETSRVCSITPRGFTKAKRAHKTRHNDKPKANKPVFRTCVFPVWV